eukprot:356091-Chlamydomonas_euryale.AAC.6
MGPQRVPSAMDPQPASAAPVTTDPQPAAAVAAAAKEQPVTGVPVKAPAKGGMSPVVAATVAAAGIGNAATPVQVPGPGMRWWKFNLFWRLFYIDVDPLIKYGFKYRLEPTGAGWELVHGAESALCGCCCCWCDGGDIVWECCVGSLSAWCCGNGVDIVWEHCVAGIVVCWGRVQALCGGQRTGRRKCAVWLMLLLV